MNKHLFFLFLALCIRRHSCNSQRNGCFKHHWVRKSIQMLGFTTMQYASIQFNRQLKLKRWINPIRKDRPGKIQLEGQQPIPVLNCRILHIFDLHHKFEGKRCLSRWNPLRFRSDSIQSSPRSMALGSPVAIASCPTTLGSSVAIASRRAMDTGNEIR
jgi:hypothetical protein